MNIHRIVIRISALSLFVTCGCCGPMLTSHRAVVPRITAASAQRYAGPEAPCACGSLRDHFCHLARRPQPQLPGSDPLGVGLVPQQGTIQPPHSKFHPVPARPVFEPRATYSPPQPVNVRLVPIPLVPEVGASPAA